MIFIIFCGARPSVTCDQSYEVEGRMLLIVPTIIMMHFTTKFFSDLLYVYGICNCMINETHHPVSALKYDKKMPDNINYPTVRIVQNVQNVQNINEAPPMAYVYPCAQIEEQNIPLAYVYPSIYANTHDDIPDAYDYSAL
jgi:hypothetical protein